MGPVYNSPSGTTTHSILNLMGFMKKTGIQVASKVESFQGVMVHVCGKIAAAMMRLYMNLNP